ncbi:MAG: twin-arginine translocation signal domain-containing protein, partial [Bacteroidales bacterium]|nr:twin-arginine translocation signal domain-containing protein [Bacteroidales bacterium]
MKSNRRDFLKTATTAGAGALTGSFLTGCKPVGEVSSEMSWILESAKRDHSQTFNMSGYSAPPVPLVRIGIIGLGDRGAGAV